MSEVDDPTSDLPDLPVTGHREVDAALARLTRLDVLPVTKHAGEYELISTVLRAALDERPAESQP